MPHLLEEDGDAVVQARKRARVVRYIVPVHKVGGKHSRKHEKLLARQPHNSQHGLNHDDGLAPPGGTHFGQLLHVLVQVPAGDVRALGDVKRDKREKGYDVGRYRCLPAVRACTGLCGGLVLCNDLMQYSGYEMRMPVFELNWGYPLISDWVWHSKHT